MILHTIQVKILEQIKDVTFHMLNFSLLQQSDKRVLKQI